MRKSRIVAEGKFLRFRKRGTWEYVEHNNCKGIVIIVAKTQDGKVLFVEQHRAAVDRNVIEFPAGLISDHHTRRNESVLTAARRELEEETGYRARRIRVLLTGPVSSGFSADRLTMARAYGLRKVSSGGGDASESITVHAVPLQGARSWLEGMARKGRLIEPKIYAGLYFLQNER